MAGVVSSGVAILTLAGCGSGPVSVAAFTVPAHDQAACRKLIAALPSQVADQARVSSTGSPYAAAYGDPAIVLRCGVGSPQGWNKTAPCQTVNNIDWFVPDSQIADNGSAIRATLVYRSPSIDIDVPASYRAGNGPSNAMVDLSKVIEQHTKVLGHCQ